MCVKYFYNLFLFVFILNNLATAQNAKQYFYYTNKAELSIVDSNYSKAVEYYDSSSRFLTVPLAQDIYNLTLCNILLKNYDRAFEGVRFLIERGCDSTLFYKVVFDALKRQKRQFAKFMSDYPILIANYQKKIDRDVMREIDIFLDSVNNQNDYKCSEKLQFYFTAYNYLNEGTIGVNYQYGRLSVLPRFSRLIYNHYYETDLTPFLKKALEMGYLKPEVYAQWLDLEGFSYGTRFNVYEINNEIYLNKWIGMKEDIDNRRKAIGLCTLDEQAKKTIFWHCFNPHRFEFFADIDNVGSSTSLIKYCVKTPYTEKVFKSYE